jgi:hypothetical protein
LRNKPRQYVASLITLLVCSLVFACDSDDGGPDDLGVSDGTIDSAAPDSTGLDSAAPDSTGLDSAAPDSTGLDSAAPDSTGLDSTAPDSTAPDSTGLDSAAPDSTAPDSTGPSCTPEGQSHPVVPGAPPCCSGLQEISCDAPDSSGQCQPCSGALYCTKCGDGTCGPGENKCRCPADCS